MDYNKGKQLIEEKVHDFSQNKADYMAQGFNETSARSRFIDPFFQALGWNLNQTDIKPHMWDVIREYSGHSITKRPDYAFRINGELKFFVEAKAPHVHLTNKEPVFQAKRYAFSTNGKAPIVILTDFEEFRVFNALKKPQIELPLEGVMKQYDLTYEKYLNKWDLLYGHFSREAVADGALEELKGKLTKKTKTLDREFLEEITHWREMLARNLALRNSELTVDQLNVSVQRILDRLIFIRNLEDRQIEQEGKLLSIAMEKTANISDPHGPPMTRLHPSGGQAGGHKGFGSVYSRLVPVFRKLDREYNGLLFKQHFSEKLNVDDKVMIHIIKHLSWPLSPYQFDVIEPEILGRIYEKFLGSKIRLTAGHRAKVEEKPEVRKAGGVYYTPQYIVDYIVKNTVGEKIKGKTPEEIKAIKIVDPACGSGSFLLGAFDYLMNYHLEWYGKLRRRSGRGKGKYKNDWYETADGEIRLSVEKKADILKNNIFGVDIDREATEVAIMSLYLKLLDEGFDKGQAMLFLKGHVLPDMSGNIKCGNSLIGSDYFDGQNISLFDDEEAKKVNAFDWEVEFSEIFSKGGFDAVIGNPPYGFHEIHKKELKPYLKSKYLATSGSFEHYFIFYDLSLSILRNNGLHGFIVPVTWLTIPSALSLRKLILDNYKIKSIDWLPELVFENAKVNTLVSIISKSKINHTIIKIHDSLGFIEEPAIERKIDQKYFTDDAYTISLFRSKKDNMIIKKILNGSSELNDLSKPCSGYNPYEVGKGEDPNGGLQTKQTVKSKPYHSFKKISKNWKPEIIGRNISRYSLDLSDKRWIKYGPWLAAPRDPSNFFGERIIVQEIVGGKNKRIVSTYLDFELYYSRDVIPIKAIEIDYNSKYFLGIINSKMLSWYHHKKNPKASKGLFPKILVSDLKKIPIHKIDFDNKKDKSRHDQMVAYVDTMLELNKKLPKLKTEHEKTVIQRQIDATDRKIDKLVYKLYDLTDEDIRLIEESVGK